MTASRTDVDAWIKEAINRKATHIVSVCDTFDYDDYPVYVMPGQDPEEIKSNYNSKNMQRVNEVITIHADGTVTEGI